jgi:catechol 2,3-dioxygenase-like lactoylglutathione lyase family enzyme
VHAVRVNGIDHVVFNVTDAEKSVAWWHDLLGLEPVRLEEWRRGEVPFVSVRINEGTILDLFVTPRTGENVDHMAIHVVDADLDELAIAGTFDVVRGPLDVFGACGQGRGLYVRDPDGNVIELRTYPG